MSSPVLKIFGTKASARFIRSYDCKVLSIGTLLMSVSYIFRFRKADLSNIRRNVWRSNAHSCPSLTALIVAARGIL